MAAENKTAFVPESYTREELLAMDPELDSDGDGLVDVIELVYKFNRYNPDTDGDGVTDYTEFCITCTDVLVPDGDIDTDGDSLTNVEECTYGTNPDDKDSDNDNITDYDEIVTYGTDPLAKDTDGDGVYDGVELMHGLNPLSTSTDGVYPDSIPEETDALITPTASIRSSESIGTLAVDPNVPVVDPDIGSGSTDTVYSATLYTDYGSSSVSYRYKSKWFFADNTDYNQDLAIVSSLLSAIAYDTSYLSNTSTTNSLNALKDWFAKHQFADYAAVDLDPSYSDQHVSEMFIANREFTYLGETKTIVCVVIRGTNGTLDEWQSNFDLGTTADFSSTSGWTNSTNHMGFDITANRLNTRLNSYLSANGLSASSCVFWITGHSRGGALANILAAKRIDAGNEVFAYTFAAPATTERASDSAKNAVKVNYPSIFNIINIDDLVPQLPLDSWDIVRYGMDRPASIEEDGYADDWDALTGSTYSHHSTKQSNALAEMRTIATNRNECYEYPGGTTGYRIYSDEYYFTLDLAEDAAAIFVGQYPDIADGTYRNISAGALTSYTYYVEYQPACLMMLMAEAMSTNNFYDKMNFALYDLPTYLDSARDAMVTYAIAKSSNAIKHPHYPESYYLLATMITK